MKKVVIGIVGNGNISPIYLENLTRTFGNIVSLKGVCDLIAQRSAKASADWGVPVIYPTMHDMFADDEIEIVVNLTTPNQHHGVAIEALKAGKNTHSEKPLAVNREDAGELLALAKASNLLIGCAPDTFLGAGIQTCRRLLDDGYIGRPIGVAAYMTGHGHESWHPDPEFYYEKGGGPMLDMGPYYVTALVSLLGPVGRLTGVSRRTFPTRTITSPGKYGKTIDVEVDTHVTGIMEFAQGAVGTIITTFDTWRAEHPFIEIYGTEGSMQVPDPNTFGGPVRISRGTGDWHEFPLTHPYGENSRGLAVADMAMALRTGRPHRASGDLAYHVLDVMLGFGDASRSGAHYSLPSTCQRPAPLPSGLLAGQLDQ